MNISLARRHEQANGPGHFPSEWAPIDKVPFWSGDQL